MRRSRENFLALKEQRGVTAIEIFVVLVVIGIMAGAATPWILGAIQTYRVRAAAWELAGDLRLARQKAVSLQRGHRICFAACGSPVPTGAYLLERLGAELVEGDADLRRREPALGQPCRE